MDQNELNEVGTLLHIMETIVTNHPKLAGIARTCQRRLEEINNDHLKSELINKAPTPAEIKAAQHTTGALSLKQEVEEDNVGYPKDDGTLKESIPVERRV